jgi:hypothetical protein
MAYRPFAEPERMLACLDSYGAPAPAAECPDAEDATGWDALDDLWGEEADAPAEEEAEADALEEDAPAPAPEEAEADAPEEDAPEEAAADAPEEAAPEEEEESPSHAPRDLSRDAFVARYRAVAHAILEPRGLAHRTEDVLDRLWPLFDAFNNCDYAGLVPGPVAANAIVREERRIKHYQLEGLCALLASEREGVGFLLADDMGLGKTFMIALALFARWQRGERRPCLLVVHNMTRLQWVDALCDLRNFLSARWRLGAHELPSDARSLRDSCRGQDASFFSLATYTDVTRGKDALRLAQVPWGCIVLDEAHKIGNARTKQSKELRALAGCAQWRLAATATPVMNCMAELQSIAGFALARGGVTEEEAEEWAQRAKLRRTHHDAGLALPPMKREAIYVDLGPSTMRLYAAITAADERTGSFETQQAMRRIAQGPLLLYDEGGDAQRPRMQSLARRPDIPTRGEIAAEYLQLEPRAPGGRATPQVAPKVAAAVSFCERAIDEARARGDAEPPRFLLFTQLVEDGNQLHDALRARGHVARVVHGNVDRESQTDNIELFVHKHVQFLVLSINIGAVGLNLQVANYVVCMSPSWNPFMDMQAIARCHRQGQTRAVEVRFVIARGTIDEDVLALQMEKLALAERVAGEGDTTLRGHKRAVRSFQAEPRGQGAAAPAKKARGAPRPPASASKAQAAPPAAAAAAAAHARGWAGAVCIFAGA